MYLGEAGERQRSSWNWPAIRVYTFGQARVESSGEYSIIGRLLGSAASGARRAFNVVR